MAKKQIGKIVNFFGLKGQLKVSVTSSSASERFRSRMIVFLLSVLKAMMISTRFSLSSAKKSIRMSALQKAPTSMMI